jgi:hypothetical protein
MTDCIAKGASRAGAHPTELSAESLDIATPSAILRVVNSGKLGQFSRGIGPDFALVQILFGCIAEHAEDDIRVLRKKQNRSKSLNADRNGMMIRVSGNIASVDKTST